MVVFSNRCSFLLVGKVNIFYRLIEMCRIFIIMFFSYFFLILINECFKLLVLDISSFLLLIVVVVMNICFSK